MTTATEHYDRLLGPVYTWMLGDYAALVEQHGAELDALGVKPGATGSAVDLGAGSGHHALALTARGFQVIAVDSCALLNRELRARGLSRLRVVDADLLDFRAACPPRVDAVLCMGDTLTHVSAFADVDRLLDEIAAVLAPGGVFVATFRDYVSRELEGDARFILVRAEAQRILTCFLEYGESVVLVHDLLHERVDGTWTLRASSYPKLRLDPRLVTDRLQAAGLRVHRDTTVSGMVRIVARHP